MAEVWNPPAFDDIATSELVTAAYLNQLGNSLRFLKRVAYTEFTSDVSVTATTVGTANQIVSSGAITYEAVPHLIEMQFPQYTAPAQTTRFILRDGTTVLGTVGLGPTSTNLSSPYFIRCLTPTAASHTYNFAAWLSGAGTGTVEAGTGGTAGDATTFMPGFIAIYRIPT